MGTTGLYEVWTYAGETQHSRVSATVLKDVGGWLVIASAWRKARVGFYENTGGPHWTVQVSNPVGRDGAHDRWDEVDDYSSFAEARREARRLVTVGRATPTRDTAK